MTYDSTQTSSAPPTERQTETIGLVVDEGVPAGVAAALVNQPAGRQVQVQVANDRIPLDDNGSIPMVELARRYRSDNEWDIVVLITDLPMRLGTTPLVADYNTEHRSGCAADSTPCRAGRRHAVGGSAIHQTDRKLPRSHPARSFRLAEGRPVPGTGRVRRSTADAVRGGAVQSTVALGAAGQHG